MKTIKYLYYHPVYKQWVAGSVRGREYFGRHKLQAARFAKRDMQGNVIYGLARKV